MTTHFHPCEAIKYEESIKLHGCYWKPCKGCGSEVCGHWRECPKCVRKERDNLKEELQQSLEWAGLDPSYQESVEMDKWKSRVKKLLGIA